MLSIQAGELETQCGVGRILLHGFGLGVDKLVQPFVTKRR